MSYEKTTWQTGDVVTAEKLNKLEDGVQNATELPSVTAEDDGDVLTVVEGEWAKATPSGGGGSLAIGVTSVDGVDTLNKTWQEIHDALAEGKYCVIVESTENFLSQTYVSTVMSGDGSYVIFVDEDAYVASSASGYPVLGGAES